MKLKGKRIAWVAIPLLVALLPVALLLTASSAVGQQEIPTIEEAAIQVGLVVTGTQEMKVLERPYRNTDSVLQVGPSLVSTETLSDTIYAPLIVNKWPWAPELLVLFGGDGEDFVDFWWDVSSPDVPPEWHWQYPDPPYYRVQRSDNCTFEDAMEVEHPDWFNAVGDSLPMGTSRCYRVRGELSDGRQTPWSPVYFYYAWWRRGPSLELWGAEQEGQVHARAYTDVWAKVEFYPEFGAVITQGPGDGWNYINGAYTKVFPPGSEIQLSFWWVNGGVPTRPGYITFGSVQALTRVDLDHLPWLPHGQYWPPDTIPCPPAC